MKYIAYIFCILLLASSAWCSESIVLNDGFEGKTIGNPSGISYASGKDGQGVVIETPSDSIEYPAKYFSGKAGRIEFDMMFPKPIPADRKFWTLLSDTGAGIAFKGGINVHFRDGNNRIEYAIFNENGHNWCYSKTSDWQPGKWYHIALHYGPGGMKLEVDGTIEDSNPCTQGLSRTPKKLGWDDYWVDSPSVMIDNLKTYRFNQDSLDASSVIVSPKGYGFFEGCNIDYGLESDGVVTLELVSKLGTVEKTLIDKKDTKSGLYTLPWNVKGAKDGKYDLRLTIQRSGQKQVLKRNLIVNTKWKWKKVRPQFDNFIPTGMYYFCEDDATYINRRIDDPAKAREYYEKTIKDNADHGINLLMMVWTPKDRIQMVLDIAKKYDVKVIIHLPEIAHALASEESFYGQDILETTWNSIKDIKNHPALAGYYVIDEPSNNPDMAARISTSKKILEAMDPKHPAFSCLLGAYEDLLKAVDYQVLVIDIYPIVPGWSQNLSGFESEVQRGIKNAAGKPVWVIPQAFGKPNVWLIPTEAELNGQVWVSLANGAKGFVYFIYQSTTGFQGEWLQGLVDMQLKPMDNRWEAIAKINADIKKLTPLLLDLKPAKFEINVSSDKLTVKGFTDKKKKRYVIVVNKDVKNPITANWSGKPATNMLTGEQISGSIKLEPGGGMLLQVQ